MTTLTTTKGPGLLDPLKLGALQLPNRVIMAPLTRCRASEGRVPNVLMAEYYRQRASAGLIISEATAVSPMGVGYPDTPGIWSDEQVEGWQLVTEAVHSEGGRLVLQLWHVGRIPDPAYLHGKRPVAPSAIAPEGHANLLRPKKNYVTPRALELDEIPEVVQSYRVGAKNAMDAVFDGVEIHGANGYLLNQFLSPGSNHRADQYGGSVENRARLMLEVVDVAISVWARSVSAFILCSLARCRIYRLSHPQDDRGIKKNRVMHRSEDLRALLHHRNSIAKIGYSSGFASGSNLTLGPAPDGGDDPVGVGGPDERLGRIVGLGEEAVDGGLEVDDRLEHAAFEPSLGQLGEEALHGVEPGGGGRGEVEGPARMALQPSPHLRVLVDGVVVENGVDDLAGRDLRLDGVEEADELLMPVALHAAADDPALQHVERGEQRGRAVALVIVGHGPRPDPSSTAGPAGCGRAPGSGTSR